MNRPLPIQYEPVEIRARVSTLVHVSREQAALCAQHGIRVISTRNDGLIAFAPTGIVIGHSDGSAA